MKISYYISHCYVAGAISAAIPSEIYGYWQLHERYGQIPWKMLFEPTIDLCKNGFKVSKYLANALRLNEERVHKEESMAEIFINPKTNQLYQEGEIMYRPKLAETLKIVAEEGIDVIYGGGRLGKMLAEDIQQMGGIITEKDLQDYR